MDIMSYEYRGYTIDTTSDIDRIIIRNFLGQHISPFQNFRSTREAERVVDVLADADDRILARISEKLQAIRSPNVIMFPRRAMW
jgi:hypothetical protein